MSKYTCWQYLFLLASTETIEMTVKDSHSVSSSGTL